MSQLQSSGYQELLKGISSLLTQARQQARAVYTLLVQELKRTWLALALAGVGGVQVTCTGGELDSDYSTLNGALTQRALQSHFFDIALVGVSGVDERGYSVQSPMNAIALELMLEHSDPVIIVTDHSKMGVVGFARIGELGRADVLITDKPFQDAGLRGALKQAKVEVKVATSKSISTRYLTLFVQRCFF